MAADVQTSLKNWSTTEGSNLPTGATTIGTNLDDNLRMIQAVVRQLSDASSIASASTTDLGSIDAAYLNVTGTTTITALGTVSAGIYKWVWFSGALTLTHNGTSLILPTAANITTAAGDAALFLSHGSGNWRCLSYLRANGQTVAQTTTFSDGTVSAPGIAFTSDADTGIYRIGTNSLGIAAGGTLRATFADALTITGATSGTFTSTSGGITLSGGASSGSQNVISVPLGDSNIAITAGTATSGTGNGRGITLTGGNGYFSGDGGSITLTGGRGSTTGSNPYGGTLVVGGGGISTNSSGGDITLTGGTANGGTSSDSGGSIYLVGGAGQVGDDQNGGSIYLTPGVEGTGGGGADGEVFVRSAAGNTILQVTSAGNFQLNNSSGVNMFRTSGSHWYVDESIGIPTVTSGGGTSPTIRGTDAAFLVTLGSGAGTSLVITFATAFSFAPIAVVSTSSGATIPFSVSTTTTTLTVTFASAPSTSDKVHAILMGYLA